MGQKRKQKTLKGHTERTKLTQDSIPLKLAR